MKATREEMLDIMAHEGAHIIAGNKWGIEQPPFETTWAPPGEHFADCLGRFVRGPEFREYYGCPGGAAGAVKAANLVK